jgi:hypothetical protein
MAKRKGASETLISGFIMACGFGAVWAIHGAWWWVFPFVFAGLMPFAEGVRGIMRERLGAKNRPHEEKALAEKKILLAAKEERGRITPAVVALKTDLSTEKAEKVLEDLAKRGYATMEVTTDGRVEFLFPEFGPRIEERDGGDAGSGS